MNRNDSGTQPQNETRAPVTLSLQRPQEEPCIPLLEIPYALIPLYSFKPRKWLRYCGYAICGTDGSLRLAGQEGALDQEEMEEEAVNPGDHFIFHPYQMPKIVDIALRDRTHSAFTSQSRAVPDNLKIYYNGCPFSKVSLRNCNACHLIPRSKGEDYLRAVLAARGEVGSSIGIDDSANMLVMDVRLHNAFDTWRTVAFMLTPNIALNSTEIPRTDDPPATDVGPGSYRVTVQCFEGDELERLDVSHGKSSDLAIGCGSRAPPPLLGPRDVERPNETILHLIYGSVLLQAWAPQRTRDFVTELSKVFYPKGKVKRGEDPELNEERDARRTRVAVQSAARGERVDRRGRNRSDGLDLALLLSYYARGTSPAEVEAQEAEAQRKWEEQNAQYVADWQDNTNELPIPDSESNDRDHILMDPSEEDSQFVDIDEKPVSIQEALSRTPPRWPTLSNISTPSLLLTHDSSGDSTSLPHSQNETGEAENDKAEAPNIHPCIWNSDEEGELRNKPRDGGKLESALSGQAGTIGPALYPETP